MAERRGARVIDGARAGGRGVSRLEAVFETMPVACVLTDALFRVRGWNPAAERLFGFARGALIGRSATAALAPASQRARLRAAFRRAAGGETIRLALDTAAQDGAPIACEWTGAPFTDGRGAFAGLTLMASRADGPRGGDGAPDEDQAMVALRLTTQLHEARERADQANRSKNEFLANMSHELRTPLNAVIGFSEILKEEMLGRLGHARYVEYAGDIHASAMHLLRIIDDILDWSKLEAGQLRLREERVDLAVLARGCARLLTMQAEASGVALEVALAPDLPPLRADGVRLKQVLVNLLSNAVKFTPRGGRVRLSVEAGPAGVALTVADNGIGMGPEEIPQALERFGQIENGLSRRHSGTGLGLPLSKQLVELHGGSLEIRSRRSAGTTVRVLLPAERIAPAGDGEDAAGPD